jgi:hypothetical protein
MSLIQSCGSDESDPGESMRKRFPSGDQTAPTTAPIWSSRSGPPAALSA